MAFPSVTHVIFDLDGTLLNTEYIYENAFHEICQSFGKEYPWDVRMKVMGAPEPRGAEICITELGLPTTIEHFLELLEKITKKEFGNLSLMPGAAELIRHLHESNVPFCLATSSGKAVAELKMSSHQKLFDLHHHKVMGSTDPEVKNGKPAPDIFFIAAERFPDQPNPSKCLVFEDSPNGVTAAIAAGMQCVMVPDKCIEEDKRKEATIVLESLEHFQPENFGLPPFKNQRSIVQNGA